MSTQIRLASLYADLDASLAALRDDYSKVTRARAIVERALRDGQAYYGINTGFGALSGKRIPADQLEALQRNLLLSHAVGVGDPVSPQITRLMLQLKIHALGLGYSGISEKTFLRLLHFAEQDLIPVVPSKGSLGASGDLAPLAHLSLPLIGLGEFWGRDRAVREVATVLQQKGLAAVRLQAKDGLSLINGTQLMSAYGAFVLEKSLSVTKTADILGAMSLEALQGSRVPFDARFYIVRPQAGMAQVCANLRQLLADSEIIDAHRHCGKVQDPYCLRCMPQVHGASRHALHWARSEEHTSELQSH